MLRVILLAGCLANDPCLLSALPLQRTDVPAAPAWVLHVDSDKLRPSAMGQYLLEEMEKPETRARLGAFWAALQLDPRKHLRASPCTAAPTPRQTARCWSMEISKPANSSAPPGQPKIT